MNDGFVLLWGAAVNFATIAVLYMAIAKTYAWLYLKTSTRTSWATKIGFCGALVVAASPLFVEALLGEYILISRSGDQASYVLHRSATGFMWQKNWNAATAGKRVVGVSRVSLDRLVNDQTVWPFRNERNDDGDLGITFRGTDEDTNLIARAQKLFEIPDIYTRETVGTPTGCLPIVRKTLEESERFSELKQLVEERGPTHQWTLREKIFVMELLTEADGKLREQYGIIITGIRVP